MHIAAAIQDLFIKSNAVFTTHRVCCPVRNRHSSQHIIKMSTVVVGCIANSVKLRLKKFCRTQSDGKYVCDKKALSLLQEFEILVNIESSTLTIRIKIWKIKKRLLSFYQQKVKFWCSILQRGNLQNTFVIEWSLVIFNRSWELQIKCWRFSLNHY